MDRIRPIFSYILAYILWMVSVALGALALFFVREAYLLALVVSASRREGRPASEVLETALQARAADQWSIFFVGILTIVLIVYLENYYRTAVPAGSLWARFSLVSAIEIGVIGLANAVYFSFEGQIRPVFGKVVYVLTLETLLVALFAWLWFYLRRKSTPVV